MDSSDYWQNTIWYENLKSCNKTTTFLVVLITAGVAKHGLPNQFNSSLGIVHIIFFFLHIAQRKHYNHKNIVHMSI